MIYLDTSFIAPLVISESSSDAVEALLLKIKAGELTTSRWTEIELASLLARRQRMGELTAVQAASARQEFHQILDETFQLILPVEQDFSTAVAFLELPGTGLRAGDAFHLAQAANRGAKKIYTLDRTFIKAGKLLKLPVSQGI